MAAKPDKTRAAAAAISEPEAPVASPAAQDAKESGAAAATPAAPTVAAPRAPMSTGDRVLIVLTASLAVAMTLLRIGSFGIWDPWELGAADIARNLADGALTTPPDVPTLGPWLVARSFGLFGVSEMAGRLPIALAGLLALGVVGLGVSRAWSLRVGLLATLITASTPLLILNSRAMMGAAPSYLGSALVFFAALELAAIEGTDARATRLRIGAGVALALGIGIGALGGGMLLAVAPPLLGIGAALIARGDVPTTAWTPRAVTATVIAALAAAIGLGVARAVLADVAGYSAWLGGAPREAQAGTFEIVIEQVFHGFAPWTAVLPIGFGWIAYRESGAEKTVEEGDTTSATDEGARRASLLGLGAVAWAAFAFAAVTMYDARYGTAPYPAPVALGIVATIGVAEIQRRGQGSWAAGLVAALLALLLLRDFRSYPVTPAGALALSSLTAPEAFNPLRGWLLTLVTFAGLAFLGMARDRNESMAMVREDLRIGQGGREQAIGILTFGIPMRAIRAALGRGWAHVAWLFVLALLTCGVLTYGILSWTLPDDVRPQGLVPGAVAGITLLTGILRIAMRWSGRITPNLLRALFWVGALSGGIALATGVLSIEGLSSLALRVGRYLLVVPFAIVLGIAAFRALRFGFHALGDYAIAPMVAVGVLTGLYVAQGWQPELSQHFSPREVYDTYNALARDGEPLGEYHVSGRAAAYYTDVEVEELDSETAALTFLERAEESRVWLAFRADDLASLDRAYRARSGRHLFIADARSSNVLLATNQPIEGRADGNYLANAILDTAPTPEFPVGASFDRRIELVGYDLDAPRGDRIGPGDPITVTWYWRCLAPVPGSYQIFLHVDGMGQRLNGDHEPVDGRYPVRLWSAGDIIVDPQELRIPANFPPGTYSFNIGFYSGETRLEVVEGREDDANRVIAGTIQVR